MPFSLIDGCREFTINKNVLSAECKKADGQTWVDSTIDLDQYFGNMEGKFTWGEKGFSESADSISVVDGLLIAQLQTSSGKYMDDQVDLDIFFHNNDGVLEVKPASSADCSPSEETEEVTLATEVEDCPSTLDLNPLTVDTNIAPGALDRSIPNGSALCSSTEQTKISNTLSSEAVSVNSSTRSISSVSSSVSKGAFHSSFFRSHSKHLLIEDTCSKFELKGAHLHVECRRLDGSVSLSSLDLDTCIGNNDGKLEWDMGAFSKSCESFFLEGFFLVARCRHFGDGTQYSTSRLDLRTRLRNADGFLIIVEIEKKLSVMLSEVPWMKFKVIAEPDLSVFASHPVIQQTLVRIAETTVEHVTIEMHKQLTVAMEAAIKIVTASAMSHVSLQIQTLVQDSVGCATAHASATEAEYLHSLGGYRSAPTQFNGTGSYNGGAYSNGRGTIGYNESGFTPISQTGFQQGGFTATGQNGFNSNTGFIPDNQNRNGFNQTGFMPSDQNGFTQTGFMPAGQNGFNQTGFSQAGFAPVN